MAAVLEQWVSTLGWTLVYKHVPPFPALEGVATQVAGALAMGDSVARFLLCLFLAYPFSAPLALPLPAFARHLYCGGVGILFAQFAFGVGWVHLLLPSVAVYVVVAALRATGLSRVGS